MFLFGKVKAGIFTAEVFGFFVEGFGGVGFGFEVAEVEGFAIVPDRGKPFFVTRDPIDAAVF